MSLSPFMKTIIIREEDDYEMQITLPMADGIIKVVSVIVIYNSKNLIRAFAQRFYPTPPEQVKYHINHLYENDFRWLMNKKSFMADVIKAVTALDQILEAATALLLSAAPSPTHNNTWPPTTTASKEIGA